MKTWLTIVAGDNRAHGGHDGYDDQVDSHYSWDSKVPRFRDVQVGDRLVFWDKKVLLGVSVIDHIKKEFDIPKRLFACPACGGKIKERTTKSPRWRCQARGCGHVCTDDERKTWIAKVTTFRSEHSASWIDLRGLLSEDELRPLGGTSQHAFRPIDWHRFEALLSTKIPAGTLSATTAVHELNQITSVAGGHKQVIARARIGQAAFRRSVLNKFGPVCAISGIAPLEVLEAAHLYQYSHHGVHDISSGGFFLRRDLHSLFDRGLISIDPDTFRISMAPSLSTFDSYSHLEGQKVQVSLTAGHRRWLSIHWEQFRERHRSDGNQMTARPE